MGRDEFGVLQNFDRMKECKERDDVPNLKYIQTAYSVSKKTPLKDMCDFLTLDSFSLNLIKKAFKHFDLLTLIQSPSLLQCV